MPINAFAGAISGYSVLLFAQGRIYESAFQVACRRAQEATAKAKLEKSTEVNSEIKRLCDWLDSHDTSFSEYDDMVIRRVVECIITNKKTNAIKQWELCYFVNPN